MSEKVKSQHVGRKALLYVRQSSTYQVHHNLESQKLQYAMQERLVLLGWRETEVIDEDLGCSAAGTVTRSGFTPAMPMSGPQDYLRSRLLPSGSRPRALRSTVRPSCWGLTACHASMNCAADRLRIARSSTRST